MNLTCDCLFRWMPSSTTVIKKMNCRKMWRSRGKWCPSTLWGWPLSLCKLRLWQNSAYQTGMISYHREYACVYFSLNLLVLAMGIRSSVLIVFTSLPKLLAASWNTEPNVNRLQLSFSHYSILKDFNAVDCGNKKCCCGWMPQPSSNSYVLKVKKWMVSLAPHPENVYWWALKHKNIHYLYVWGRWLTIIILS